MKIKVAPSFVAGAVLLALTVAFAQTHFGSSQKMLVVPPDAGMKGNPGEWKIRGGQSNGGLAMVEIKTAKTGAVPTRPPHVHTREDEGWYVIEGELSFQVGDEASTAGPGTFVWAPRNIPHQYYVSKAPARYLLMLTPAGMEPLFAEVEDLKKKFTFGSPAYETELHKLQAKYGAYVVEKTKPPEPAK